MSVEEKMNEAKEIPPEMKMTLTKEPFSARGKLDKIELPSILKEIYGGDYFFIPEGVSSSYVVSREGIYSVRGYGPEVIAGGSAADAFSLALERVFADAIIVASGTLNAEPETTGWNYQSVFDYPHMKNFSEVKKAMENLRKLLGKENYPPVYFMTNSGEINPSAAVFSRGSSPVFIVTNGKTAGEKFPAGKLDRAEVLVFDDKGKLDTRAFVKSLKKNNSFLRYEGGRKGLESFLMSGLLGQLSITQMPNPPSVSAEVSQVEYVFGGDHSTPRDKIFAERVAGGGERIISLDLRGITEI